MTARITVGWMVEERPTPAPRRAVSASSRGTANRPTSIWTKRLHLLEVDGQLFGQPGLREAARAGVVLRKPV